MESLDIDIDCDEEEEEISSALSQPVVRLPSGAGGGGLRVEQQRPRGRSAVAPATTAHALSPGTVSAGATTPSEPTSPPKSPFSGRLGGKLNVSAMGRLAVAESKAQAIVKRNEELDGRVHGLEKRIRDLQQLLHDQTTKLKAELQESQDKVRNLERDLICFNTARAAAKTLQAKTMDDLRSELQLCKADQHRVELEKADEMALKEKAEQLAAKLEQELAELQERTDAEISSLQGDLEKARIDGELKEQQLTSKLRAMEAEAEEQRWELQRLQAKSVSDEEEMGRLRKAGGDRSKAAMEGLKEETSGGPGRDR
eukprot:TRINITY_DN21809_c0_g1_i2.p1 TRINITY_DN21809_c0_g1~~TRINITY_DN21809_c0_g1_i2.p1  ORF type:complete len:313 (+),score=133.69 TRINITY_DN21809_c0_g1_i2:52-990(+)